MNNPQKPSLSKRVGAIVKQPQKIPQWSKWGVAVFVTALTSKPIYALGAGTTRLLLDLFQLSEFNPGNLIGTGAGYMCVAGSWYAIFKLVDKSNRIETWGQALPRLNFWGLSVFAVIGSGLATLSLSLILLPGMSFNLKLALVFAVFIAILVAAALIESQWETPTDPSVVRGRPLQNPTLLPPEEDRSLPWGRWWVKKPEESLGYFILGAQGMGKSTWLEVMMTISMEPIGAMSDTRGLVIDSKPDDDAGLVPFLEALGVPYKIFNPLDVRCCAWAVGEDVIGEARAVEFAAVLIPEREAAKETNPYFTDAARLLVTGAIVALQQAKGKRWTLRDLVLTCSHKRDFLGLLKKHHPNYKAYEEFFKEKEGKKNEVLTTIQANLLPLSVVAARWECAPETISLRDWLHEEYVLVMGSDFEFPTTLKRINQMMFKFIASGLKSLPDNSERRVWIYIDELAAVSPLPELESILSLGRSKSICTVLATQNLHALMRILGREKTMEILGLCRHKAILGVDNETANILSQYFSDYEYIESRHSNSWSDGPQGITVSSGVQENLANRRTIIAQQLTDANFPSPGPGNGLSAFFVAPGKGIHFHTYPWGEIQEMRLERLGYPIAYERIDDDDPTASIRPWDDDERQTLELMTKSTESAQTQQTKSRSRKARGGKTTG